MILMGVSGESATSQDTCPVRSSDFPALPSPTQFTTVPCTVPRSPSRCPPSSFFLGCPPAGTPEHQKVPGLLCYNSVLTYLSALWLHPPTSVPVHQPALHHCEGGVVIFSRNFLVVLLLSVAAVLYLGCALRYTNEIQKKFAANDVQFQGH